MARRYWIVELDVDGNTFRWSTRRLEITTADGDIIVCAPGLSQEPQLSQGEEISVQIVDPSQDWTQRPERIELSPSRLLLWRQGTVYERAEVYSYGHAATPTYGPRGRLSWDIRTDDSDDGLQMPDILAVVDDSTWPVTLSPVHSIPEEAEGVHYPIIMGYPGYVAGRATPYPVVPVPIAQWAAAAFGTTYYAVGERPLPVVGSDVYVENVESDLRGWLTAAVATDLLGRRITVVPAGSTFPGSITEKKSIYAGFSAAEGGGLYRGAYDVIEWLLRTWGGTSAIDWTRMRDAEWLNRYQVDTWINAPTRPWEWLQATLLRQLPVTVQRSTRGRYLERDRYTASAADALGSLDTARNEWSRDSDISWADIDVANEFTAEFRIQRSGVATARRILTSSTENVGQRVYGTGDERVSADSRCVLSQSRYGLRQSSPIKLGWTWDEGTALAVLQDEAAKRALPWREVSGWVRDGADMRTGDVYLLTDDEMGLADTVAIVAEPPVVARGGAVVRFRLPWGA